MKKQIKKAVKVWCEHLTLEDGNDPESWVLLGDKPRIEDHPLWQFCPLCGARRPFNAAREVK